MTTNTKDLYRTLRSNIFAAQDAFRSINANLMASFVSSEVGDGLLAHIRLEYPGEVITPIASDFSEAVAMFEKSFLALYDRGILKPNAPLTGRGEQELHEMRARTGIGYVAPAPTQRVEAPVEDVIDPNLDAQVIRDWNTLSSDQIKHRINNSVAYRKAFNRLSETDAIGAGATTHEVGGRRIL